MIKNILTLTLNDLAIAFKNKTIFLIIFIPFFVFVSLKLVDKGTSDIKKIRIGLIQARLPAPVIVQSVSAADRLFTVVSIADETAGNKLLQEKKIDGLLLSDRGGGAASLVVLKKESLATLALVESIAALQKGVEGKDSSWISRITALQEGGIQKQTLPTWILMLVLLVGFIVMPAQVAEEKEKKLLLGLLQTPIREIEWLIAKVLSGMTLILAAVLFLHLLGAIKPENMAGYAAFIIAGGFCFSSYGILLGFLCRTQASARTLGVMFYLPHLLPSALSDFSEKLTLIAPFLPSYRFYEPIREILLNGGSIVLLSPEWLYLMAVGAAAFFCSYLLMKRRWLM